MKKLRILVWLKIKPITSILHRHSTSIYSNIYRLQTVGNSGNSLWIPLYIMWNIWRERNNRIFEGEERSIFELKRVFLLSLFEWRTTWSDLCHLYPLFRFRRFMYFWVGFCFPCTLPVYQGGCFLLVFIYQ